jgi:hypothetical protein
MPTTYTTITEAEIKALKGLPTGLPTKLLGLRNNVEHLKELYDNLEIPSITGLATEVYVTQAITGLSGSYIALNKIVNDVTTGGADKVLSAEQGKILKGLIGTLQSDFASVQTAFNTLNNPDDVNFDTLMEIGNAIKNLNTLAGDIISDDDSDSSTTKAASSRRVKELKDAVDAIFVPKSVFQTASYTLAADETIAYFTPSSVGVVATLPADAVVGREYVIHNLSATNVMTSSFDAIEFEVGTYAAFVCDANSDGSSATFKKVVG